jgi:STE24 endopeptidase
MEAHRVGLPVAIVLAVVAAGTATLVLSPRHGLIEAQPVAATDYFSPSELDRAHDFRVPQRWLGVGGLLLSGGTLALLAARPPRRVRRALARAERRPILGAAAAGAGISLVLVVVGLPLSAIAHQRSVDIGLSTQSWDAWFADVGKSAAISALFTAGGAALFVALVRRFPRNWWLPGSVALVALSAAFVFLSPVVLEPLFNRFTPLEQGPLRSDVLELARRSGVDVGQVYRVDASRRTTGTNAYVNGLGHTKRVVLYDTLIEKYSRAEVDSVVAHELGHVKHRDVPRGILWLAIVAPAGVLLVQRLTERIAPRETAGPTMLPAAALSIAVVAFVMGVASNFLSRRVEARADAYALQMTNDPAAFISLERKLAITNVSEPDPPRWVVLLFGTHPPTVERIGYALTWARQH